jgi:cell division septation protein DedD
MSEELAGDDQSQSHYEVSLTAGQAFVAFVLLLLSLAASFAFGLLIGKGQADDRLVVRKEPAVINEASTMPKKGDGKIVELGVSADDFKSSTKGGSGASTPAATDSTVITEGTATPARASAETSASEPAASKPAPAASKPGVTPAAAPAASKPSATPSIPQSAASKPVASESGPVEAQLASIGDQKAAEALAAKLINSGFTSAYVDRGANDKGTVWRVRVKFSSEAEAQAAMPRLKEFSKDVWIAR